MVHDAMIVHGIHARIADDVHDRHILGILASHAAVGGGLARAESGHEGADPIDTGIAVCRVGCDQFVGISLPL